MFDGQGQGRNEKFDFLSFMVGRVGSIPVFRKDMINKVSLLELKVGLTPVHCGHTCVHPGWTYVCPAWTPGCPS